MLHSLSGGAWDPHDVNAVAATGESSVQFWDLRTMKYGITVNILCSCMQLGSFTRWFYSQTLLHALMGVSMSNYC